MVVKKKTGSEMMYRTRCVWVDVSAKRFCWSKNEMRSSEFKSVDLVGAVVSYHSPVKFSVLPSNMSDPSIDIQVESEEARDAWMSAIRQVIKS